MYCGKHNEGCRTQDNSPIRKTHYIFRGELILVGRFARRCSLDDAMPLRSMAKKCLSRVLFLPTLLSVVQFSLSSDQ